MCLLAMRCSAIGVHAQIFARKFVGHAAHASDCCLVCNQGSAMTPGRAMT